jgi:hypothetical protein
MEAETLPERKTQSFAGNRKRYLRDVCERNIDVKYRNGHGWTLRKRNNKLISKINSCWVREQEFITCMNGLTNLFLKIIFTYDYLT